MLLIIQYSKQSLSYSTLIGPLGNDTKDDEYSEHYQYFSFKDKTIITVVEIPGEESSSMYSEFI